MGAILEPWDRPEGPWERQHGHKVVRNRICIDFGVILGPVYVSFFALMKIEISLFIFVPRSLLFYRFPSRLFDARDSTIEVFARSIAQIDVFQDIAFYEFRGRFCRCWESREPFSGFSFMS